MLQPKPNIVGRPPSRSDSRILTRAALLKVLRGLPFRWTVFLTIFVFLMALFGEKLIRHATEALVSRREAAAGRQRCQVYAAAAQDAMAREDVEVLYEHANMFEADDSVLFVEVYSKSGKAIARVFDRERVVPRPLDQDRSPAEWVVRGNVVPQQDDRPPYIDLVEPALHRANSRARLAGFVRIGVDLSAAQADIPTFLHHVRTAGILAVLLVIPVAFIIACRLTAPLVKLTCTVTELAQGDFEVRTDIERRDEIGQLAWSFNRMADELASKNESLVRLNAELEDRVLQRTRQLVELASKDSLTGMYNRRHLGESLSRRFAEAERYGTDLACLMIDLDNFKRVNDRYGHDVGDRLLVLTANVIKSELRGADIGARFGGDEFCVIMPHTSADHAQQLGNRILKRFLAEIKTQLEDGQVAFGMSVGVAGMQELSLRSCDQLMKAADQALYVAKNGGKNRVHRAELVG